MNFLKISVEALLTKHHNSRFAGQPYPMVQHPIPTPKKGLTLTAVVTLALKVEFLSGYNTFKGNRSFTTFKRDSLFNSFNTQFLI